MSGRSERQRAGLPRNRVAVDGPPDPRELDGDFGHRVTVRVRFADTDAMAHVNNATYLTYVEVARIDWWTAITGESLEREHGRRDGLILAEAETAFRSPVVFGETVTIESRATRIGRTSLALEHRLTAAASDGDPARLVATCRTILVRYDYVAEAPVPWPDAFVTAIEAFEGRRLRV
ncbi:MAG TPA: thioesterase family protein [Candidatus Limnocylindrales bacterium]|nr:thioesterase family protein [Candidatus Limnocylindrales bacterium]